MELKKTPKADLKNKRGLLLEIGLIVALAVVIAAFAYTPAEHRIEQVDMNYGPIEEQITEITRQDQKTPPPPKKVEVKVITDLLQVVTNDTKVSTEVDFAEFDEETEIIQTIEEKVEVIEDDQPFFRAETMPTFQGGDVGKFRAWIQQRLEYPQIAAENGISGNVIVSFIIDKEGKLTDIKVLRTPDRSLSDEVIRVMKMAPADWTPAKQRNRTVRLQYTLPLMFQIQL
ncbi:MAG: energy transducer TonB [Rikenellaceae bacterium]